MLNAPTSHRKERSAFCPRSRDRKVKQYVTSVGNMRAENTSRYLSVASSAKIHYKVMKLTDEDISAAANESWYI